MTHHTGNGGELSAPVRSRFFHGMLLDDWRLLREQRYGIEMRRLLTRVGHGAGVACGLGAHAAGDDGDQVIVDPGVALDGRGREIVVTESFCIEDPAQPTDDCGRPRGDRVAGGTLTVCVAYHECDAEPTPVLVADCDTGERCAPGAVRERYRVILRPGDADPPAGLSPEQCARIFPDAPPAGFDRRRAACEATAGPCPGPGPDCVAVATLRISDGRLKAVEACAPATIVPSNARLLDLLLCLADRVDACCAATPAHAHRTLHYVSGDAQSAPSGSELAEPLVVEVRDENGAPAGGEQVGFRAIGGGGSVPGADASGVLVVPSGADGRAEARWRLGPQSTLNTLEATIVGGGRIAFHALAGGRTSGHPPYVEAIWPPNGARLAPVGAHPAQLDFRRWLARPRIELVFEREMQPAQLDQHEDWLRVWRVVPQGDREPVRVERMQLALIPPAEHEPLVDEPGARAQWEVEVDGRESPARYVVQVRAQDGVHEIRADADPKDLLDPDFDGTRLDAEQLDRLWDTEADELPHDVWEALEGTGSLEGHPHSGDGTAGGRLHSWFEIGTEER
jgi:hypothetical protein